MKKKLKLILHIHDEGFFNWSCCKTVLDFLLHIRIDFIRFPECLNKYPFKCKFNQKIFFFLKFIRENYKEIFHSIFSLLLISKEKNFFFSNFCFFLFWVFIAELLIKTELIYSKQHSFSWEKLCIERSLNS